MKLRWFQNMLALLFFCWFSYGGVANAVPMAATETEIKQLLQMVAGDARAQDKALTFVREHWRAEFTPMVLEAIYLARPPAYAVKLIRLLEEKTGQNFGYDINGWYQWLWNRPPLKHPHYTEFKARLYALIDPRFNAYFSSERTANIRLDEVRWGGVRQDGIPPLRRPKMTDAAAADYLADDNIVFGIAINGDVRAYPKRILAWHELFVDEVGGVPVAGVYCTLCGTVILYQTVHRGINHKLGTSGFLYRSNKLMYDQDTQSLWNTIWGTPVIGPLADQDITLQRLHVVTTTWGEWRRRHPDTRVLSLDTGHRRDYSEGAAYGDYFATDELMFNVPKLDRRLKNKDEVLALIFSHSPDRPLAIAADYLAVHPIYHDQIGGLRFVVLTDPSGANRVFESNDIVFTAWDGNRTAKDSQGTTWTLSEDKLTATDGRTLNRLPAHRAFWFGWYSAYSNTRLVY